MNLSTLPPPPRAAPSARPTRSPPPPVGRSERWNPDRAYSRAVRWALLLSVVLHGLFLLISPAFLRVGLPPGESDTPWDAAAYQGLQGVAIAPAAESALPEQAAAEEPASAPAASPNTPLPSQPALPSGRADADAAGVDAGSPSADALRPGFRDRRLHVAPREVEVAPEQTEHERYIAHLHGRLDAYNDSIGAETERARRATDWTVKDKDGGRWGVSPGKIHLGDLTLPLPVGLAAGDRQKEEAAAERARQRGEIDRQEMARKQRDIMDERIRATRERKNRERGGGRPHEG